MTDQHQRKLKEKLRYRLPKHIRSLITSFTRRGFVVITAKKQYLGSWDFLFHHPKTGEVLFVRWSNETIATKSDKNFMRKLKLRQQGKGKKGNYITWMGF